MKQYFPGHFRLTDEEYQNLWKDGLFVVDTNILLNMYRYSDTTRTAFMHLLEEISARLWLPHQAAQEYLNNRLTVIKQQEQSYSKAIASIQLLSETLSNSRQHPFVTADNMKSAQETFDSLVSNLTANQQIHTNRYTSDEIQNSILALFTDRTGPPYTEDQTETIFSDGELRYKHKIPPGYKDEQKNAENESLRQRSRRFGDLLFWNQVLDKAKESDTGIILITDDRKEDWWEKHDGRTIGPHPDLVKEFVDKTGQKFAMYQADRFLEKAKEYFQPVDKDVLEEVRALRNKKREKAESRRSAQLAKSHRRKLKLLESYRSLSQVRTQIIDLIDLIRTLEERQAHLRTKSQENEEILAGLPPEDLYGPSGTNMTESQTALNEELTALSGTISRHRSRLTSLMREEAYLVEGVRHYASDQDIRELQHLLSDVGELPPDSFIKHLNSSE